MRRIANHQLSVQHSKAAGESDSVPTFFLHFLLRPLGNQELDSTNLFESASIVYTSMAWRWLGQMFCFFVFTFEFLGFFSDAGVQGREKRELMGAGMSSHHLKKIWPTFKWEIGTSLWSWKRFINKLPQTSVYRASSDCKALSLALMSTMSPLGNRPDKKVVISRPLGFLHPQLDGASPISFPNRRRLEI